MKNVLLGSKLRMPVNDIISLEIKKYACTPNKILFEDLGTSSIKKKKKHTLMAARIAAWANVCQGSPLIAL